MIRVKNEREFLFQSINSIIEQVDEVVIIDNNSIDGTIEIIEYFTEKYKSKVKFYKYTHDIAGMGECYKNLQKTNPNSPGLLHNYYNWCLSKCSMPFIMKWDGDMIALDKLYTHMKKFKKSRFLRFDFGGYNVAYNKLNILTLNAIIEPRVYPKLFTSFKYIGTDCEELCSWVISEKSMVVEDPLYLHMKYCKSKPNANFSPLYSETFTKKLQIGCKLPDDAARTLNKYSTYSQNETY